MTTVSTLPLDIGTIHFVGIGGIGMSGIAEILHSLGYQVQGSDMAESPNVLRLREKGIDVAIGHDASNIGEAAVVVVSTAVKNDNPEVMAARERLTPVVRRAEMLGELMRLKWAVAVGGTHGKTTTTTMVAALLDHAGIDPTVINGGIINAYGTNARLGKGDWMVVEADESDGSFLRLPATIAVVTNIDPEHMDHYGDFDALRYAFDTFVGNIPFYGVGILCVDHPEVQALIPRLSDRRVVTYGFSRQADVRIKDMRVENHQAVFNIRLRDRATREKKDLGTFRLPMLGEHNVANATAAICIGLELGLETEQIQGGIAAFGGVKRRFTVTGEAGGITVVDDYGHHPVEIAAVLRAARQATDGGIIAVMQPHRYSRLNDLFEDFCTCFNDADKVVVTDVFAAGEEPIAGAGRDDLARGLQQHGHRNVKTLDRPEDLPALIADIAGPGDYVICLGAGNITQWANSLPDALKERLGS